MEKFIAETAAKGLDIVCYPETYLPGLRGQYFPVEVPRPGELRETRDQVTRWTAAHPILVIIPMEWPGGTGLLNAAFVISSTGEVLGCLTKTEKRQKKTHSTHQDKPAHYSKPKGPRSGP